MERLKILLLGPPDIRIDNRVVTFRTRKSLALLAYLAAEKATRASHTREHLAGLLWGDSDPSLARTGLRTALTHLRQALEPQYLSIEREEIGLHPDREIDLDINVVGKAVKAIHTQSNQPEQKTLLLAAVEVIRGEFLQGLIIDGAPEFDHWVYAQRQVWGRQIDAIFECLSRLHHVAGDLSAATSTALQWLALDPTNESAARHVMNLQFAAGDRISALRTFDSHLAVLNKTLALKPSAETVALAERIRREGTMNRRDAAIMPDLTNRSITATDIGAPGLDGKSTQSEPLGAEAAPSMELVRHPMVGRGSEFAQLVGAATTASHSQPRAMVIDGEAGIGKTRLLEEFGYWARAQAFDVWQGRAFEAGGHIPYQVVVSMLRSRMEHENAPDDLLSDVWLSELSRLLPELRERYPDLPSSFMMEGPEALARLFEAVTRFSLAITSKTPVIVMLDDMQWTDDSSCELLNYQARRWAELRAPVLLVLTARAEALGAGMPLPKWLHELARALPVARLSLGRLTSAHVAQLTQFIAGYGDANMPEHVANAVHIFGQWLYEETYGQPFFVVETLRAMLERRLMERADKNGREVINIEASLESLRHVWHSLDTPAGVRDVIRARLARLKPEALRLLTAAAILGQVTSFETLRMVASVDENDGLQALDELLASQLLVEASNGNYLFTHDKIRAVAVADAGDARRRVLHRRAFEALEKSQAPPAVLAHHAREAGQYLQAFRSSLAAGEAALLVFSLPDAMAQFQQALKIYEEFILGPGPDIDEIDHLYRHLGRTQELSGNRDQARAIYEHMLQIARDQKAYVMECAALNRLATLTAQKFDPAGAFALLQQAHEVAIISHDRLSLAETEWNLAQTSNYSLDASSTLEHGWAALALAREIGDVELVARCLNVLTYAERAFGLAHDALAHAEESSRLYVALGNRAMHVDSAMLTVDVLISSGLPRQALVIGQKMLDIGVQIGNHWVQCNALLHLARAYLDIGEFDQALQVVLQGVSYTEPMAHVPMLLGATLGSVQRARLELDAACRTHLDAMQQARQAINLPGFWAAIAAELCADYVAMGNWLAALKQAYFVVEHSDYDVLPVGHNIHPVVRALVHAGEHGLASQHVDRFASKRGEYRRYRVTELWSLAILTKGSVHDRLALLTAAADLADEIGLPGESWQILAEMTGELVGSGDFENAKRCQSRAMEIVHNLARSMGDNEQRHRFIESARLMTRLASEASDES